MKDNSIVNRFSDRMSKKKDAQSISDVFDHDYIEDGSLEKGQEVKQANKLSAVEWERKIREEEIATRQSRTSKMIDEMHNGNSIESEVNAPGKWDGIKTTAAADAFDEVDNEDLGEKDVSNIINSIKWGGKEACEDVMKDE